MSDEKELDFQQALEQGTKKMNLTDLQQRGFKSVKVLDERTMEAIVRKAVDRVVSTQTAEEKARIIEESHKELERLMKEHSAVKSRAQLLESDKNELIGHVEALQRELELTGELEEERLHKKFLEGTASMQKQVEEVKRRAEATGKDLEKLRVENARLEAMLKAEKDMVARLREMEPRLESALKDVQDLTRQNARYQTELEGAGKRLNELESALEREQSRLREAERARTEMVEQVLLLQAKGADATKLAGALESARAQLARAEELVRDGAKENASLKSHSTALEGQLRSVQGEHRRALAEAARLEGENGPLREEVEHLRAGTQALEAGLAEERMRFQSASGDSTALRERLESAETQLRQKDHALDRGSDREAALERSVEESRSASQAASVELASLRGRLEAAEGRLREKEQELDAAGARAAELGRALEQSQSAARDASVEQAALRDERDSARAELREHQAALEHARADAAAAGRALEEERARAHSVLEMDRARTSQLELRLAEADRLEVERVGMAQELTRLRADLAGMETLKQERDAAFEALQNSKEEAQQLRLEIARSEKEQEAQREKIVVVASDLEEIEERHKAEERELEGLRQRSQALEEQLSKTRVDLSQAHGEIQSLQEILQREQDVARTAHVDSTAAQARLQELMLHSGRLEEQVRGLSEENVRLRDQLRTAELATAAASALDHRLAAVERLMDSAREQTGVARASAADSRTAADLMRQALARPAQAKRSARPSVPSGVALDGKALLQEFFRRIRLKERLQKHVPVREKDGQRHPSELLVDVVSSVMAGDGRPESRPKSAQLEILGPMPGPQAGDLRQFLGRVSPRAGHAVSRVHEGLRQSLFAMPESPRRLVLDVGGVDLPRSYRPLVAFEPGQKEFWHGELRTKSQKDSQGIVPFLKGCVSKIPGGFPRRRVRFRLDARYFSEDVIRFLNGRGVSYVMEPPDRAALREEAKKVKYRPLSGGWEAGEFHQRIHPIRATQGRFVVVRHRLSRKGRPDRPMFRDRTWEYCVFAVDSRISPWRAYQAYAGREESQAQSESILSGFARSRLMGRRRRSHGALFPLYLLGSDLIQWFRRKALPQEERDRGLDSLRTELLRLPPSEGRGSAPRLPVLRKGDRSRRDFERVMRKIRGLRPARPFKFRK